MQSQSKTEDGNPVQMNGRASGALIKRDRLSWGAVVGCIWPPAPANGALREVRDVGQPLADPARVADVTVNVQHGTDRTTTTGVHTQVSLSQLPCHNQKGNKHNTRPQNTQHRGSTCPIRHRPVPAGGLRIWPRGATQTSCNESSLHFCVPRHQFWSLISPLAMHPFDMRCSPKSVPSAMTFAPIPTHDLP